MHEWLRTKVDSSGSHDAVPLASEQVRQALNLLDCLAEYDKFQFENRIKPDYCNAGGLVYEHDGEGGFEWCSWYDCEGNEEREIDRTKAIRWHYFDGTEIVGVVEGEGSTTMMSDGRRCAGPRPDGRCRAGTRHS